MSTRRDEPLGPHEIESVRDRLAIDVDAYCRAAWAQWGDELEVHLISLADKALITSAALIDIENGDDDAPQR